MADIDANAHAIGHDPSMRASSVAPKCIGSTADLFHKPIALGSNRSRVISASNFFKSAIWSPDGTCIQTANEDNCLRTFIIPADLLHDSGVKELTPYSILCSAEPIVCYAHYSAYALSNPSTTLVLSSIHDHPLRLTNALAHDTIVASYPFVSPLTESYYKIYSLAFPDEGHHFLAGSDSIIGLFDLSRTGEGPVRSIHTVPSKRRKAVGGGVGMKGIIASMDTSTDGIVAAGTFTRNIGLYDHQGADSCVAVFSLAGESGGAFDRSGGGVTQVLWSPCGRYLYVAERQSSCVLAYDIRVTGKLLVKLEGRNANTSQRLGIDTVHTAVGHEVWAGCLDGSVKVWSNAYESEESKPPDAEWMAHEDAVSSVTIHSTGSVVATCSGRRSIVSPSFDELVDPLFNSHTTEDEASSWDVACTSARSSDNTLKLWAI